MCIKGKDLLVTACGVRLTETFIKLKDRKYDMPDADKPEFAKQSFKGFVMRIMMMIDMFKKKSDY